MNKAILLTTLLAIAMTCQNAEAQKPELTVPTGHGFMIIDVQFSPNDQFLISSSVDGIKIWDINSGAELKNFPGFDFDVSSDGKYIATSMYNGTINIYNINDEEPVKIINDHSSFLPWIRYSKDNDLFISASKTDSFIVIRNQKNYDMIKKINTIIPSRGDFSVNHHPISISGDLIIIENTDTINFIQVNSGKIINKIDISNKHIRNIRFSSNNETAFYMQNKSNIFAYDIIQKTEYPILKINDNIHGFEISPDGKSMALFSDSIISIYNCKDYQLNNQIKHSEKIFGIRYSHNGNFLAVYQLQKPIIYLYDLISGKVKHVFSGHCGTVWSLDFSKNINSLYSGGFKKPIFVWDFKEGKVKNLPLNTSESIGLKLSDDGEKLVNIILNNSKYEVNLWNLKASSIIKTLYNLPSTDNDRIDGNPKIKFFNNDKLFAIALPDSSVKIFNLEGNIISTIFNQEGEIIDIDISNDGNYLILASLSILKLFDLKTMKLLKKFDTFADYIGSCKFLPDDNHFCVSTFGYKLFKYDIHSYTIVDSIDSVGRMLFSDDMHYLIDYHVDKLRKWNLDEKKLLFSETISKNQIINSIALSPDNKFIVTGLINGSIVIFDFNTGKELITLFSLDSTDWAVVAPDGRFDASPNGMKLLYYVQGLEVLPLESFFEKYYTPGLLKQILDNTDNQTEQRGPVDFRKTLRLPPKVAISSNITETTTNMTQARIFLQVSDAGGGIDEVRLYQNGKLLPDELILDKKTTNVGRKQEITYSVPLVSGKNEFKATGFNIDRTESIPVNHVINRNAVESSINLYLMAIGVNIYKNAVYNLTYAKPDAEAFVKKVDQYSSELFKKIVKYEFYDNNATRTNIEDAIGKIRAESRPEDVFVFYYAGHGVMSEEEDGLPAEFYLIPHDVVKMYGRNDLLSTKGLSASWLKDNCAKIKAQKQLVLLDACHSGGAVESFAMLRNAATEKAILQLARSAGITVLAAAGTEQGAAEFAQLGHGVFTFALLEGLDGYADGKKDGKVTVKEIEAYLNDRVPALTLQYRGVEQYPNGFSRGQDFPIGVVKK